MKFYRSHILLGINETSIEAGAKKVELALKSELSKRNLQDEIDVLETGPLGFFAKGVCLKVYPENTLYENVTVDDIPELVEEHFLKGRPVRRLLASTTRIDAYDFNYKERNVLENSGIIDPEDIEEYIGVGGYEAWEKALLEMTSQEIIDQVKKSELRGRGGAGFPTGLKWSFTAPIDSPEKHLVINADEGEPGTFKDRLIMEGDPHKLLEGMMIACRAIGANKGFIYIRGEYKLCIERLKHAINQCRNYGILGEDIFGSGYSLDFDIKVGAGAYVCGEETALIESLEGNRGNPRSKPPFPGVKGLWQTPTVVNNVETIANVPTIINKGAAWYKSLGVNGATGTKVFTLMGDVAMPGLTEVPMGITLRDIITKYGGGMLKGKKFKGALVGGAAGVILSDKLLDVKMDYESLKEYTAVLGSGAILVMGEEVDMVEMLWSILRFFRHESCGKCFSCRLGTQQLYNLICKIRNGEGKEEDLESMIMLSDAMVKTSFCALGQSPYMPIKSSILNFRNDFLKRIK
jgi:NADH:ubiquinone oxidoreductase subunit F (NADH-binding)/(2Fe-2S) ferredoxin